MFRLPARLSRGFVVGALAVSLTAAAAVGGTVSTFAVSQTTGSEGAYDFLQTTNPGGALQGEVGSGASTGLGTPFGIFGKYGAPSGTMTKGIRVVGISKLGWGVVGENIGGGPALYAFPNKNDGIGLDAESDNKEGVYGEAHGTYDGGDFRADDGGYGINAYSTTYTGINAEGVVGDGIDAYSDDNHDGAYGFSENGYGVEGYSQTGDGVHANVKNANSGVAGINEARGSGVYGRSRDSFGVKAVSSATPSPNADGGFFEHAAAYGQSAAGPGVYGVNTHSSAGGFAFGRAYQRYTGVSGYASDGAGVYGYSARDFGMLAENGSNLPTLVVEHDARDAGGTAEEILAGSGGGMPSNSGFNFAVEANGGVYAGDAVTSAGGSLAVTRNPQTDTVTYGAESTEPMVEDVGSAHLVNGAAAVAIDGAFRQTIQDARHYLVFITPEGDSKGLYVTQKSPAGFVVREAQGGRSTLDFDYKIVAQRYGVRTGRLPHLAEISPRMAQLRLASLHPSTADASANIALASAVVAPPTNEGSQRASLLAQARHASAAAHWRMARPPAPPSAFLTESHR